MKEGTLTSLVWGLFIILIGSLWIVAELTRLDMGSYFALGVGLILIGLNLARRSIGTKISKFSLGLGIVALLVGLSAVGGLKLPLVPTIVVVIGIFIVAEATAKKESG
ncbi:MAG: hypothetical protein NTX81_09110 [Candidatus Bathyarchaeota archaeon]|nr:hypothetical protein [Candidatus Bathyarchaeota archaeon]